MQIKIGETRTGTIQFVRPDGTHMTVDFNGEWMDVEVKGQPQNPVVRLKGKVAEFICTDVVGEIPVLNLGPQYFESTKSVSQPGRAVHRSGFRVPVRECETIEFKSSILFSPETHQPNSDQPFAIAKEIAAFMNTKGGTLYLGLDNDGYVVGVETDFLHLGEAPLVMNAKNDSGFTYKNTRDGYELKLRNLIRWYLGDSASGMISDPEWLEDPESGLHYVKLTVPATEEEIVYLGRNEHLVYRTGSESVYLTGRNRDLYTKRRFHSQGNRSGDDLQKELEAVRKELEAAKQDRKAIEDKMNSWIERKGEEWQKPAPDSVRPVQVAPQTTVPLEGRYIELLKHPGGLVYKNILKEKATTWSALYECLLELLAGENPSLFATLPDLDEFKGRGGRPAFVRKGTRTRLHNRSKPLGSDETIFAELRDGTKKAFYEPTDRPLRLLSLFGIRAEDVRIWTGSSK